MNAATIPSGVVAAAAAAAAEKGKDGADDKFKDATDGIGAAWEDDADAEVGDEEGRDDIEVCCVAAGPTTCEAARCRAGVMRARSAAAVRAASTSADLVGATKVGARE